LYDLALGAGLADPKAFVNRCISFEKRQRLRKKEAAK
jgi:hypothetical protein